MRSSSRTTQSDSPVRRRVAGGAATAVLGLTMALGGSGVAPAAAADSPGVSGVILGVGADETQRIVTWYSTADTPQQLQVAPTATLNNGQFPADAATFAATGGANIASSGGYNRHATDRKSVV